MLVLGIESTCDEMAIAIVKDGLDILSNVVASQSDLHRIYGGVYPELAARTHVDQLIPVLKEAFSQSHVAFHEIDLIAVANGPGLPGPLFVGLNAAKGLSLAWDKPLIGVNHVEAHLYAAMMSAREFIFPALGLVLSGGHTFMVLMKGISDYELIGTTVDDALGEAYDKVAAMLELPYPGGPIIEALAKSGDPSHYQFKAGTVKGHPWDFSFSGLKTQVLYAIKGQNGLKESPSRIEPDEKRHLAAAFQETALNGVVSKVKKGVKSFSPKALYIGGGVSNNERLRELFRESDLGIPLFWPSRGLSLDNAAMIAGLGFHRFLTQGKGDPLSLETYPRMSLFL